MGKAVGGEWSGWEAGMAVLLQWDRGRGMQCTLRHLKKKSIYGEHYHMLHISLFLKSPNSYQQHKSSIVSSPPVKTRTKCTYFSIFRCKWNLLIL